MLIVAGLNFPSGYGPNLPTAKTTGAAVAPGSGGYYNITTVTGPGLATLTGLYLHPRPTAPFTSIASRLVLGVCTGMSLAVLVGLILLWQICCM